MFFLGDFEFIYPSSCEFGIFIYTSHVFQELHAEKLIFKLVCVSDNLGTGTRTKVYALEGVFWRY